jgi:hypothetical protein
MPGDAIGMTSGVEPVHEPSRSSGRVSLDDLARRKGAQPVTSLEEMREDGVFRSDEELDEFLRMSGQVAGRISGNACRTSCSTRTCRRA